MAELEFPNNSHAARNGKAATSEKPRVQKVVTGNTKLKKKSEARKFADIFISDDIESVRNYVFMDVLVPAIKKAVVDIVSDGINMIIYGDTSKRTTSSGSRFAYNSCFNGNGRPEPRTTVSNRTGLDYESPILVSRIDAEEVLSALEDIIDQYGFACVSDLYDACGLTTSNYQLNKFGWQNLAMASVVRVRDGYMLKLPKATAL